MTNANAITLFAAAAALPAVALAAGALLGGPWPIVALLSMTVLVFALDRLDLEIEASRAFDVGQPWALAFAHFGTLCATLWAVGQPDYLDLGQKAALVIAMGLYAGQVSNAVAHELIHRNAKSARRLGTAIFCSLLNGQHVSAHMLLHHPYAGTEKDPCSAPMGRSYYRFALEAGLAECVEGLRAETRRRSTAASGLHPYVIYAAGALFSVAVAWALGGAASVLALLIISFHAMSQLLLSDYVQHYGLRRRVLPSGKLEPMGPQHSWNAPHAYSGAMMLNAPRHSDHHMQPGRHFPDLTLNAAKMPMLPKALPVMAAIALVPPVWRRVMDPKVRMWMPTEQTTTRPDLQRTEVPATQ